jgi:hypothetical protein
MKIKKFRYKLQARIVYRFVVYSEVTFDFKVQPNT